MGEPNPAPDENIQEEQLNRAIEELRGVLHEEAGSRQGGVFGAAGQPHNAELIMNIPVDVQIVLGSAEMAVSELMALQKGSTVALNRRIGEAVDVVVNGRKIARGEITVLEHDPSRFGIRLTEVITATKPA
jgi:flagellar motor switch protein FliN/FliY